MSADIITLPRRADAPVAVLPRDHFGLRDPVSPAERAALGDREHICPTLDAALSTKWEVLATMARQLAAETRALGWLRQAVTAVEIADIAETVSAEVEAR